LRRARFFTASGSANETRLALRIAVSWGLLRAADADAAQALIKRVLSMLWKLTH
jgi:hypothetical protein